MPDKHKQKQSPKTLPTFMFSLPLSLSGLGGGGRIHAIICNLFFSKQFGIRDPKNLFHRLLQHFRESSGTCRWLHQVRCPFSPAPLDQNFLHLSLVHFLTFALPVLCSFISVFSPCLLKKKNPPKLPQATNNLEPTHSPRQLIILPLYNWSRAITDS